MDDKELLLSKIPENQGIGNKTAREQLGWDEARYQAAKAALLADGVIKLGPGKGGSIKRKTAGDTVPVHEPKHEVLPTIDFTQFASDEEALLSLIPANGQINNRKLQKHVGWDDAKFQTVRKNLLDTNKIVGCTGGPGGASRLFRETDVEKKIEAKAEPVTETAVGETNEPVKDIVVITSDKEASAKAILARLRETGYPNAEMYVAPEGVEFAVKLRRRYPIPINPDVRERLTQRALAAAEFVANATPATTEAAPETVPAGAAEMTADAQLEAENL